MVEDIRRKPELRSFVNAAMHRIQDMKHERNRGKSITGEILSKERVRQRKLYDEGFTQARLDGSVLNLESDKRKASILEGLLLDKWNDTKYMGINYQIHSNVTKRGKRRLEEVGAAHNGLSRYLKST